MAMCGRIVLKAPAHQVALEFAVPAVPELGPRYNIAPTQPVAVVRADADGARICAALRWGLVLPWSTGPGDGPLLLNARSETAAVRPAFREAFRRRRCLVPADGFYEWQQQGRQRIPHYFSAADGALLALAGLWESWRDPAGQVLESCTVLTTAACDEVAPVHHRMPVIVANGARQAWLTTPPEAATQLQDLLAPSPAGVLRGWQVAPLVNRSRADGPELIAPVGAPRPRQFDLFGG
jgi:putative SOS response-associated peptidase YedK